MTLIGRVLAGRYEIIEEIGSGGMAVVYKAKCQLLNRFVAVKVLRPDLQNDEEFVRRFNVEAQAAASLTHPNIVSIYDVGNEDGLHYIVMEYIEGKTLKEYIEEKRILPWREASDYAIQIARGLEQAHKNSIIHRDVKPHNIIMTADGVMKVTDFGIARANVQATVTCEDSAIGSVHYISPEQARGGYTDERSDIYSLGVVLYEMLTGRVPFDSDRPVTVAIMHLQEKPVMPRELNISIPRPIENIVLKAMTKEVSARYKSATDMIRDLQSVLNDPNREISATAYDADEDKAREEAVNMGETIKMPALNIDADSDGSKGEKRINQKDVRPIAEGNDLDSGIKEEQGMKSGKKRKAEVVVDKKKQNKVTWIAILSAVAATLILALMVGSCIGIPALFGCTSPRDAVVIPKVEGMLYDDALNNLESETADKEYKFSIIKEQHIESDKPEGVILSQEPAAESKVKMTEEIIIKVKISAGKKKLELRDYVKDDFRDAELQLQNLGFKVEVERKFSDEIPKDVVIAQNPVGGAMVSKGDKIVLYVSNGPEDEAEGTIEVGNYVGKSRSAAEQAIKGLGLEVAVAERYSSTVERGNVISQNPDAGAMVKEGKTVTIYVSKGKEPEQNNTGEGDNGNTGSTGEGSGTTGSETAKKSTTITIYGPKDRESALVQVKVNGKTVYSQTMKKGSTKAIKLESASSSAEVEILYDGVSQQKATVNLH